MAKSKYRPVTKLPQWPGHYIAANDIKAWKGFKRQAVIDKHGSDLKGVIVRVVIPKGAKIVFPRAGYSPKLRASAIVIPREGLVSPVANCRYKKGRAPVVRVDPNLNETCTYGYNVVPTREDAKKWASG